MSDSMDVGEEVGEKEEERESERHGRSSSSSSSSSSQSCSSAVGHMTSEPTTGRGGDLGTSSSSLSVQSRNVRGSEGENPSAANREIVRKEGASSQEEDSQSCSGQNGEAGALEGRSSGAPGQMRLAQRLRFLCNGSNSNNNNNAFNMPLGMTPPGPSAPNGPHIPPTKLSPFYQVEPLAALSPAALPALFPSPPPPPPPPAAAAAAASAAPPPPRPSYSLAPPSTNRTDMAHHRSRSSSAAFRAFLRNANRRRPAAFSSGWLSDLAPSSQPPDASLAAALYNDEGALCRPGSVRLDRYYCGRYLWAPDHNPFPHHAPIPPPHRNPDAVLPAIALLPTTNQHTTLNNANNNTTTNNNNNNNNLLAAQPATPGPHHPQPPLPLGDVIDAGPAARAAAAAFAAARVVRLPPPPGVAAAAAAGGGRRCGPHDGPSCPSCQRLTASKRLDILASRFPSLAAACSIAQTTSSSSSSSSSSNSNDLPPRTILVAVLRSTGGILEDATRTLRDVYGFAERPEDTLSEAASKNWGLPRPMVEVALAHCKCDVDATHAWLFGYKKQQRRRQSLWGREMRHNAPPASFPNVPASTPLISAASMPTDINTTTQHHNNQTAEDNHIAHAKMPTVTPTTTNINTTTVTNEEQSPMEYCFMVATRKTSPKKGDDHHDTNLPVTRLEQLPRELQQLVLSKGRLDPLEQSNNDTILVRGHSMSLVPKKDPTTTTTTTTPDTCILCSSPIPSALGGNRRCDHCHLCEGCITGDDGRVVRSCPGVANGGHLHDHPLQYVIDPDQRRRCRCDIEGPSCLYRVVTWACAECDFDVCSECMSSPPPAKYDRTLGRDATTLPLASAQRSPALATNANGMDAVINRAVSAASQRLPASASLSSFVTGSLLPTPPTTSPSIMAIERIAQRDLDLASSVASRVVRRRRQRNENTTSSSSSSSSSGAISPTPPISAAATTASSSTQAAAAAATTTAATKAAAVTIGHNRNDRKHKRKSASSTALPSSSVNVDNDDEDIINQEGRNRTTNDDDVGADDEDDLGRPRWRIMEENIDDFLAMATGGALPPNDRDDDDDEDADDDDGRNINIAFGAERRLRLRDMQNRWGVVVPATPSAAAAAASSSRSQHQAEDARRQASARWNSLNDNTGNNGLAGLLNPANGPAARLPVANSSNDNGEAQGATVGTGLVRTSGVANPNRVPSLMGQATTVAIPRGMITAAYPMGGAFLAAMAGAGLVPERFGLGGGLGIMGAGGAMLRQQHRQQQQPPSMPRSFGGKVAPLSGGAERALEQLRAHSKLFSNWQNTSNNHRSSLTAANAISAVDLTLAEDLLRRSATEVPDSPGRMALQDSVAVANFGVAGTILLSAYYGSGARGSHSSSSTARAVCFCGDVIDSPDGSVGCLRGHAMHPSCAADLLLGGASCPTCREPLFYARLGRQEAMDALALLAEGIPSPSSAALAPGSAKAAASAVSLMEEDDEEKKENCNNLQSAINNTNAQCTPLRVGDIVRISSNVNQCSQVQSSDLHAGGWNADMADSCNVTGRVLRVLTSSNGTGANTEFSNTPSNQAAKIVGVVVRCGHAVPSAKSKPASSSSSSSSSSAFKTPRLKHVLRARRGGFTCRMCGDAGPPVRGPTKSCVRCNLCEACCLSGSSSRGRLAVRRSPAVFSGAGDNTCAGFVRTWTWSPLLLTVVHRSESRRADEALLKQHSKSRSVEDDALFDATEEDEISANSKNIERHMTHLRAELAAVKKSREKVKAEFELAMSSKPSGKLSPVSLVPENSRAVLLAATAKVSPPDVQRACHLLSIIGMSIADVDTAGNGVRKLYNEVCSDIRVGNLESAARKIRQYNVCRGIDQAMWADASELTSEYVVNPSSIVDLVAFPCSNRDAPKTGFRLDSESHFKSSCELLDDGGQLWMEVAKPDSADDLSVIACARVPLSVRQTLIGARVRRGRDWRYGDQDGGDGNSGIIIAVSHARGKVLVKWDGVDGNFSYRARKDGPSDLVYANAPLHPQGWLCVRPGGPCSPSVVSRASSALRCACCGDALMPPHSESDHFSSVAGWTICCGDRLLVAATLEPVEVVAVAEGKILCSFKSAEAFVSEGKYRSVLEKRGLLGTTSEDKDDALVSDPARKKARLHEENVTDTKMDLDSTNKKMESRRFAVWYRPEDLVFPKSKFVDAFDRDRTRIVSGLPMTRHQLVLMCDGNIEKAKKAWKDGKPSSSAIGNDGENDDEFKDSVLGMRFASCIRGHLLHARCFQSALLSGGCCPAPGCSESLWVPNVKFLKNPDDEDDDNCCGDDRQEHSDEEALRTITELSTQLEEIATREGPSPTSEQGGEEGEARNSNGNGEGAASLPVNHRLKMCPSCCSGPFMNDHCNDMRSHHGECSAVLRRSRNGPIENCTPRGIFRVSASEIAERLTQLSDTKSVSDVLPRCPTHNVIVMFNGCMSCGHLFTDSGWSALPSWDPNAKRKLEMDKRKMPAARMLSSHVRKEAACLQFEQQALATLKNS